MTLFNFARPILLSAGLAVGGLGATAAVAQPGSSDETPAEASDRGGPPAHAMAEAERARPGPRAHADEARTRKGPPAHAAEARTRKGPPAHAAEARDRKGPPAHAKAHGRRDGPGKGLARELEQPQPTERQGERISAIPRPGATR